MRYTSKTYNSYHVTPHRPRIFELYVEPCLSASTNNACAFSCDGCTLAACSHALIAVLSCLTAALHLKQLTTPGALGTLRKRNRIFYALQCRQILPMHHALGALPALERSRQPPSAIPASSFPPTCMRLHPIDSHGLAIEPNDTRTSRWIN